MAQFSEVEYKVNYLSPDTTEVVSCTILGLIIMTTKSTWSLEQNKRFEEALAIVADKDDQDRWEKLAEAVGGGKTVEDAKEHYQKLEEDIKLIECGAVQLPRYNNNVDCNNNGGRDNSYGKVLQAHLVETASK